MFTIRLTLAYDGTPFNGWQIQQNGVGVQAIVQGAVRRMTKEKNVVIGASRTDAGVHAMGQVAHFQTRRDIPPGGWVRGLNSCLPPSVVVMEVVVASPHFHARRDALWKCYRYVICQGDVCAPFLRQRVWHVPRPLNRQAMGRAARQLVGRHDFRAFTAANDESRSTVRTLYALHVKYDQAASLVTIDVIGAGFLKQMVRNIVGTLIEIGQGKRAPNDCAAILASRDRRKAGRCAPADGLYLMEVGYADIHQ